MVLTSGQIGLDPKKGELVGPGIAEQAERTLKNLAAVLEGAGLGLDDVVKTTVYLVDMNDFETMNAIYAKYFGGAPPARSTVAVAALPRGARVEIEAMAVGREY
jgi:2-iminobutanoate/2-iminopropanoate deaminase